MAKSPARLAATGIGVALLVGLSTARAADPHAAHARNAGHSHDPKGSSKTGAHSSDPNARRAIAGGPTGEDTAAGVESAELSALREAERQLFPQAAPAPGNPWPSELPLSLPGDDAPHVHASGLPPAEPTAPPAPEGTRDLSWLTKLEMPDLPVRWDDRVVRYLEYFRDDPRGRATFANLFRHSGRWQAMMRRALRKKSLPEDLVWVAMIESGFEQIARSPVGAVGLWQFMPETAKIYGLTIDRWLDQRLSAPAETDAAAEFLADLHRRFGSWELALAAYNMGYGGLSSVVRRYNTNDFWSLARTEGTLPWETTLYVPKILAAAVVAHNLGAFGFSDLQAEGPIETDEVTVPPGTPLALVAQAAGCSPRDVESLNPELRAARTPPLGEGDTAYPVRVPAGKGATATQALAKTRRNQPPLDRYVVRFGETLEQVAATHKTTTQKLVEMNAVAPGEAVRGGAVLLVPKVDAAAAGVTVPTGPKQSVVVPADLFVYPDRRRVFYRVQIGDTLREIASALHVGVDDLDRWNDIDPGARLQEGMTLQAFVAEDLDLSHVVVVPENDVRVLAVGSDEFFAAMERERGFKRVTVTARSGDTLESIGRRFAVPVRTMERVNRRGRTDALKAGDTVVVYAPSSMPASVNGATASNAPVPLGPLPSPPVPDLLPSP
ncbi:MAG TPA: LysM peptidoglycan-binding domain-containing protein [Polyangiaceae bacterium]|jgi:membrane-bound lytic murein transglycosylase D